MQGLFNKLIFPLSGKGKQTVEHYHRLITNGNRNLIIYSHGNATTVNTIGITSTQSINFEINRVYDIAVNEYGYHPIDIILMGRSIGTGPTLYLASIIESCKSVILISPFSSTLDLIYHHSPIWGLGWVVSWFIDKMYDNEHHISRIDTTAHLVIIHGNKDTIIPVRMGQRLYDIFSGIKKDIHIIEDGTHNYNIWNVDLIKNYL